MLAVFVLFSCKKSGGGTSQPSSGWSELGGTDSSTFHGFVYGINSITTDDNGNIYAGGAFANSNGNYYIAKWNGTKWSELGGTNTSTFNNVIQSITTFNNSYVYGAGGFTNGNGKYYIAKWNGSSWSELGGQQYLHF
jgi:hypothetical protein